MTSNLLESKQKVGYKVEMIKLFDKKEASTKKVENTSKMLHKEKKVEMIVLQSTS